MITTCPKCHQLYEALESQGMHPERRCPRCSAVDELIAAADALNARVRGELERNNRLRVAVVERSALLPLVERTGRAIEKARAAL